ncbi:TPA: hypothetical protein L5650_000555 [Pseudomonas aeruginosa]|uniref:hypothetical protein n=1 Tax=Pseudomonas aeruginosa TaxID=287 RepID=UPI000FD24A37|nr:hypothetical protein [Pseudomonas aeruginosa]EIU1686678.1 hypothetical protein [Pseudomonas aeruginosa]EKV4827411.1 hypothetical protein [Pseudomonas aeruginosa]MBA4923667.1 hypothetical protein [Pseudomonas aeruginosa]MBA5009302.1 hypothetical protein [Pseudomonas aeruginosa]MBY5273145.1 hypothetical protein [Pseudomonas aeruginosa]
MTKPKHQVRVTVKSAGEIYESPEGRLFFDDKLAKFTDLSGVRLLRCGVDTVRQLYNGMIRLEVMALFDEPEDIVEFAGYQWVKGRVGRDSGYQYRLQNADTGLILLIKNHNVKLENIGPHLKIEVSPHALDGADPATLQDMLDDLASAVLAHCETNQCAVHLALDVQGWTPSADIVERMRCRSTRVRQISGIDRIEFHGNASVYGRGETFMFGSANGMQLCIYNKTLQARATDKLDYWSNVWASLNGDPFGDGEPAYNPEETVWRIEFRFHHSIVQQFSEGSKLSSGEVIGCRTYAGLCPHLQGLWEYACDSFRLLLKDPKWYDPFWSLITLDTKVQVEADPLIERTEYRRYYKTAQGFSGKNCEMFLGQFASLIARERIPSKKALEVGRTLPFWHVIEDHYTAKGYSTRDLEKHICGLINDRYLRRGYAI